MRNKTINLSDQEKQSLLELIQLNYSDLKTSIICGDNNLIIPTIADESIDLLILDPPYNLSKKFGSEVFNKLSLIDYEIYLTKILESIKVKLKSTATIYVCGDWYSSISIYKVLSELFIVRNRITWEREKGRGSKTNWKNSIEDIWFATVSNDYYFNYDAVKIVKKVNAPYKENGDNKDWSDDNLLGKNRLTYASNLWTDLTIPFWSMPENTIHPTQKPEKLIAKLILASSKPNDVILDPFLGSGTSLVVANKLNRVCIGVELDIEFCLIAADRYQRSFKDKKIQGYEMGLFLDRNFKL